MNILIIGSGAREHAITKSLSLSTTAPHLYCCGTTYNPGIEELTMGYWAGDINDIKKVTQQAKQWHIEMAIIGPEAPLEHGLADALTSVGIAVIGPKKQLAQIETSKAFARDLMKKYTIPGLPRYKVFSNLDGIAAFLRELGPDNYVVKANGLMAGKGVKVAGDHLHSDQEAINYCLEIFAQGQSLVIEEKLIGQEFSLMCFSDGTTLVPMPLVQDHKRAYVEDKGPNTGGMGSYSNANHSLPFLTSAEVNSALSICQLVVNALMEEVDEQYKGILYGGFIATATGIYVIEFNARFGDPESLNVLSILESDLVNLCISLTQGTLQVDQVKFSPKATVCKYAVPEGYPHHPLSNVEIDIQAVQNKAHLYLAAVNTQEGKLLATGSRAAAYVGVAESINLAEEIAEQEIKKIQGPLFHREDIGTTALINKGVELMKKLRAL